MLGVHLTMDDRNVDANVLSWNCRVMKVNLIKSNQIKSDHVPGIRLCVRCPVTPCSEMTLSLDGSCLLPIILIIEKSSHDNINISVYTLQSVFTCVH